MSLLPGTLVSTEWLEDHLLEPSVRVVDIRGYVKTVDAGTGDGKQISTYTGARDEYDEAHIPGAVFVDWTADITDPEDPVPAQIASPERFESAMEILGIGDETDVVVVDHTGGHFATRLWWALNYYGHPAVAILDGGMTKWLAEDLPVTNEAPSIPKAHFTAAANTPQRFLVDDVLAAVSDPGITLVDARDPNQYSGEVYRGARRGHIPGAINLNAKSLFTPAGTWKSDEELRDVVSRGGDYWQRKSRCLLQWWGHRNRGALRARPNWSWQHRQLRRFLERVGRAARPPRRAVASQLPLWYQPE